MKWHIMRRAHCDSSDNEILGMPVAYVVFDEKDREVCEVRDLKTAMRIVAGEDFIEKMTKLVLGPVMTEREREELIKDARDVLHDLEHAHE